MCGGIAFKLNRIPRKELEKYYSQEEQAKFAVKGEAESFYWSKQPILPIDDGGEITLCDWGNRVKEVNLPKTGWAKEESVVAGKWSYLDPKPVTILASRGYEKGVWFDIKNGLRGLVVERDGHRRVYMLTKPADIAYKELTKHNRQPIEL